MAIEKQMYLGFKGRTLDSLSLAERRVVASRLPPYYLFPHRPKDRAAYQAALSAERQVKLAAKGEKAAPALEEELTYYSAVGGLARVMEAESLTTYRSQHAEDLTDISSVGFVGIVFHEAVKLAGRDATKNKVFEYLANKTRAEVQPQHTAVPLHHTNFTALKSAWRERYSAVPLLSALYMLAMEKQDPSNLQSHNKLVASNFERFAALLRWYFTELTSTGSVKRKEAPISNSEAWYLPGHLARTSGISTPVEEPPRIASGSLLLLRRPVASMLVNRLQPTSPS